MGDTTVEAHMRGVNLLMPAMALLAFAHCAAAFHCQGQDCDAVPDRHFLAYLGFSYGGDEIGTLRYTDGSRGKVTAGGIILFGLGLRIPAGKRIYTEISAGYHADSTSGSDASLGFYRDTVQLIPYLQIGRQRLGIGATYHYNVYWKFSDNHGPDTRVDFRNQAGWMVDYSLMQTKMMGYGLRYTRIEYEHLNAAAGSKVGEFVNIDGSNLAVYLQINL